LSNAGRAGTGLPPGRVTALADAIRTVAPLDAPADARLRQFFRARPQMGVQDRAFVAEGVFAFLRHRRSLEALAATSEPRLLALATLVRELGKSVREVEAALTSDERERIVGDDVGRVLRRVKVKVDFEHRMSVDHTSDNGRAKTVPA